MMKKEELWKDIPNYEGIYQVSDLGKVKSLSNKKTRKEKILKQSLWNGYLQVGLHKNGISKTISVHKIVAISFLNHVPSGMNQVVDHINEIKTDNRLENLRIVSQRENVFKTQGKYSSEYKGVSFDKKSNKWRASIFINGALINLGNFTSEYDAHLAYQAKISQI